MTGATPTGTPLISVLSLVVAILAMLATLVNVRLQLKAAAREAWMREFREQVAQLLTAIINGHIIKKEGGAVTADVGVRVEIAGSTSSSFQAISLLIAEKGLHHTGFMLKLSDLLVAYNLNEPDLSGLINKVSSAAADILQRERAAADPLSRFMAWCRRKPPRRDNPPRPDPPPGSRFVAWLVRDPPRFPN